MNNKYPQLCEYNLCTGCGACHSVCHKEAIVMLANEEGFLYPSIDKEKCVGCLACEKTCPVLQPVATHHECHPEVYACWNKDKTVREESSSGGAFSALAMTVLDEGGSVVGAAYDEEMNVNQTIICSKEELHKLRGSKYVQSNVGEVFKQAKAVLQQGRLVLFVGTPCQIAGLRNFLKKDYDNLICCDFICHGVPSKFLFKKYIEWIEEEKNIKVHSFNFRHKKSGWYDALRVVNGNCFMRGKYDSYFLGFNRNTTLRESCYRCPAIGLPRKGDLTVADFWGIGMKYKFEDVREIAKGISLVMVNDEKGKVLLMKSKAYMICRPGDFGEALDRNQPMIHPSSRPESRNTFYLDMRSTDFKTLQTRYFNQSSRTRCVSLFREYAPRFMVVGLRNLIQYLTWKRNGSQTLP